MVVCFWVLVLVVVVSLYCLVGLLFLKFMCVVELDCCSVVVDSKVCWGCCLCFFRSRGF